MRNYSLEKIQIKHDYYFGFALFYYNSKKLQSGFCGMSINNTNKKKDNKRTENLFEIMDGIIDQLNNTKRLFIAMILTVMIIPPLIFIITFGLLGPPGQPPQPLSIPRGIEHHIGEHREGFNPLFTITKNIPLIIGILWLGIGIRQWIILSKWNKKYQKYKELQKKIDEKIDNEDDSIGNNHIESNNSEK